MLDSLITHLKSAAKAMEILYVLEGAKPVARLMVDEEKLADTIAFLESKNLKASKSDFKIQKVTDSLTQYSNKGIKIPPDSQKNGNFFVYISKKQELAEKAKQAEHSNDHKELGKLLGYPECCIEFFEENFSPEKTDLTLKILENSDDFKFPFYTNIGARNMDLELINHFPCNFSCKPSIGIAKKNLEIIRKRSEEFSKIFEGMLKCAILYTKDKGIFMLRDQVLEKNKLRFSNIYGSSNNILYNQLKTNNELSIINKNHIRIGRTEFKNLGIMVFS